MAAQTPTVNVVNTVNPVGQAVYTATTGAQTLDFQKLARNTTSDIGISGTYGTLTFTWQGSYDGTNFFNIFAIDRSSGTPTTGGTTIAPADNANRAWKFDSYNLIVIRANVLGLSTVGTATAGLVFTPIHDSGVGAPVLYSNSSASATTTTTITSSSAAALAVGPSGTTNPTFNVDASTTSAATGITIKSAAAASGVAFQVTTSGTNEDLTIDAAAAGTVKIGSVASTALGLQVGSSTAAAGTKLIVQSTSTTALVVGRLGATTPALQVDANTATSITGVKIKSAATGNGVAISAIGEASNGGMKIDAQGSGVLALCDTSTGGVGLNRGNLQALQVGMTLTGLGTTQSSTPTSAQLLGGILTQTGATGAGAITLPTGTALSAACPRTPATGDTFECTFVNITGSQTLTVTGATGTTVVGGATIASAKSAKLVFTCTGSNTWNIYTIGG